VHEAHLPAEDPTIMTGVITPLALHHPAAVQEEEEAAPPTMMTTVHP